LQHFKAIAAMSQNRVIGLGNTVPWHIPEDLQWFRKTTLGQVIVLGRKTFEAIGQPLPGRTTIVLSRSRTRIPGVKVLPSLSAINLQSETRNVFICGGGQIYSQALPLCSDLFLTLVKQLTAGDVFFPPFEETFAPQNIIIDRPDFKITHYRNRSLCSPSPEP
jgi:dihydrofolate reductase